MKLTKSSLIKIIKEEIQTLIEIGLDEPASGEYETGQSDADKWHSKGDSGAVRDTWTSGDPVLIVLGEYLFQLKDPEQPNLRYDVHPAMKEYHSLEGFADRKLVVELMRGLKEGKIDYLLPEISRLFGKVTREDIAAAIDELQNMV